MSDALTATTARNAVAGHKNSGRFQIAMDDSSCASRSEAVGNLDAETGQPVGVEGGLGWQDLDRHVAAKSRVLRPVDLAHSARTEGCENFVGAETSACGERHLAPRPPRGLIACGPKKYETIPLFAPSAIAMLSSGSS